MQSVLIDITGKIDLATLSAFQHVAEVAGDLAVPFVVIGATARDLVLHHYYGARIERATEDLDFAIQVPDWVAFHVMKQRLQACGFVADAQQQRLRNATGSIIDIVPFGPVATQGTHISWPPAGDVVMTVLGMQEAFESAVPVRLQTNPDIVVDVVTPVGLMILKLVAWTERDPKIRQKDSQDIFFLMSTYEEIPSVQDAFYDDVSLVEAYDGDITLGAAHLLGKQVGEILKPATRSLVERILADGIPGRTVDRLISDSCGTAYSQFERHQALLGAFAKGL